MARTLSTLLCDMIDILDSAQTVISAPSRARTLHDALQSTIEKYEAEKAAHVNAERYLDAAMEQKHQASHERDATKAQYQAEKAAHGNAHRHLTAAIAERDAWQLSHGTLAREKGKAEKEIGALRARVAELQSGEPVAWAIEVQNGHGSTRLWTYAREENAADDSVKLNGGPVFPLFRHPAPAAAPAYGVEGERFVCWEGVCAWLTNDDDEGARDAGTRAEAEARSKTVPGSKVMRLVDADAPAVDVAKIREVIADLVTSYPRLFASESAHLLRTAIGEKA